eukprot:GFUD01099793.1.p1 GENE.GFUD01099793.1~~GFUD01099793.1.p1  ORF type:complete len:414 (+),score=71.54 GFUD01099793.1:115-1356(+)
MMITTLKYRIGVLVGIFTILVLLFYNVQKQSKTRYCDLKIPKLKTMSDIVNILELEKCGVIEKVFDLYGIEVEGVPIKIPKTFEEKVSGWLGGNKELIQQSKHQKVIQITNRLSGETTHYNPLRAKRPGSQAQQSREYVDKIIEESQATCDLCRAENMTAEETWGRIRTSQCITAANMFKISGPNNGLVISKTHHLLELGPEDLKDMLHCSKLWFDKVHQQDPALVFPMMVWDALPHAGASQVHPHMQIWLGRDYEGQFKSMLRNANSYVTEFGGNYWEDMAESHVGLGLGVVEGGAVAIVPLTSHKDHEIMIMAKEVNQDFIFLLSAVMEMYNEKLGVFCRSMGMAFPPLVSKIPEETLPAVLRVGSRGSCSSSVSDASSLDLYGVFSVNVDPVQTISALKTVITNIKNREG